MTLNLEVFISDFDKTSMYGIFAAIQEVYQKRPFLGSRLQVLVTDNVQKALRKRRAWKNFGLIFFIGEHTFTPASAVVLVHPFKVRETILTTLLHAEPFME